MSRDPFGKGGAAKEQLGLPKTAPGPASGDYNPYSREEQRRGLSELKDAVDVYRDELRRERIAPYIFRASVARSIGTSGVSHGYNPIHKKRTSNTYGVSTVRSSTFEFKGWPIGHYGSKATGEDGPDYYSMAINDLGNIVLGSNDPFHGYHGLYLPDRSQPINMGGVPKNYTPKPVDALSSKDLETQGSLPSSAVLPSDVESMKLLMTMVLQKG